MAPGGFFGCCCFKGSKGTQENYRPIRLISVSGKLVETVMIQHREEQSPLGVELINKHSDNGDLVDAQASLILPELGS